MTANLIEQRIAGLNRLCADMIETAVRIGGPIDTWEFDHTLDRYRDFLDELAQDPRLEAQLIAKRAREILEISVRIAENPYSRKARRLGDRIERCLDAVEKHLPALIREVR
jgi:hypothetical protein